MHEKVTLSKRNTRKLKTSAGNQTVGHSKKLNNIVSVHANDVTSAGTSKSCVKAHQKNVEALASILTSYKPSKKNDLNVVTFTGNTEVIAGTSSPYSKIDNNDDHKLLVKSKNFIHKKKPNNNKDAGKIVKLSSFEDGSGAPNNRKKEINLCNPPCNNRVAEIKQEILTNFTTKVMPMNTTSPIIEMTDPGPPGTSSVIPLKSPTKHIAESNLLGLFGNREKSSVRNRRISNKKSSTENNASDSSAAVSAAPSNAGVDTVEGVNLTAVLVPMHHSGVLATSTGESSNCPNAIAEEQNDSNQVVMGKIPPPHKGDDGKTTGTAYTATNSPGQTTQDSNTMRNNNTDFTDATLQLVASIFSGGSLPPVTTGGHEDHSDMDSNNDYLDPMEDDHSLCDMDVASSTSESS